MGIFGKSGLVGIGIILLVVGILLVNGLFDWLLDLMGFILIVVGVIAVIAGLISMINGKTR